MRALPYIAAATVIVFMIIGGAWWNTSLDTRLQSKVEKILDKHSSIFVTPTATVTNLETDTIRTSIHTTISQTATTTQTMTSTPTTTSVIHRLEQTDPHPDNSKIVILMGSNFHKEDGPLHPYAKSIIKNRREYAERHGYIFEFLDASDYASKVAGHLFPWVKVPMLKDTMDKYPNAEWIWWLDHDALIMNKDANLVDYLLDHNKLNSLLTRGAEYKSGAGVDSDGFRAPEQQEAEDVHFIMSQDFNGINAGSLFVRNSEMGRWIVDMWFEPLYLDHIQGYAEQQAISHMIYYHPSVHQHVGLVPLRTINAYDFADPWGWQDGDICIHFAGCNFFHNCPEKFEKFAKILSSKQGDDWLDPEEKEFMKQKMSAHD
ncbi:alpha-1,2-galactosyltransferase Gma12 [Schizosaccharomyces cryophilus OY26]|uniref:Alpha-1,2-galactosyltransferase Gma12 n=1 Tax=Schizosaccharomyces cryophilus (strain OY26 / ATCC MYA-4695 / CBS 11777 / NBRC 106824 / NRRL Y48691) TaxID=653667 RepID=S9WZ80_SCHCR|nr:alpha-1,2-galactosyltransferase Gma12 [Schizosaccharomyces cryophilus OY26]EPY50017.1 alpha-1,2-galactosyltransferase Gma12 [Schizosaccharomyces cryophilus OY26]